MKSKTFHLDRDFYRLNNGTVERLVQDPDWAPDYKSTKITYPDYIWVEAPNYVVGAEGMLVSRTNTAPRRHRGETDNPVFSMLFDCPDGVPGNSNRKICRYHGWRGTTNDVSQDAHGWRAITKIRSLKNGTVAVTVGPDLMPDAK